MQGSQRFFLILMFAGVVAQAATFIVPTDRAMARRADAIVVGEVRSSYPRLTAKGTIETVTEISVRDVLKGAVLAQTIEVREPGGALNGIATWVAGVPRFSEGERVLLFLSRTPQRTWSATDIALGKFSFVTDGRGRELAVRTESDVVGWNADGSPHDEPRRLADRFVDYLRIEAAGGTGTVDYVVVDEPPRRKPAATAKPPALHPKPLTYNAGSYTNDVGNCPGATCGNGLGARWYAFPVTLYIEPGTASTAANASSVAVTAWAANTTSSIGYLYGGAESCSPNCHTSGFDATDNLNTILWERDLQVYGIPAFICSPNGAGGTLGIGGVTLAVGTHSGPNGETFFTNVEIDVEMNQGVVACVGNGFSAGDLNTAVTHEVGHTLGFRHSDQTRAGDPSIDCTTDPSLDCSGTAIMKAFIPMNLNGALQSWDQRAAAAVYPGSPPPAPTNVTAVATTNTTVRITWSASAGAASYQVFRSGVSGPINCTFSGTSCTDSNASPNTAYLYRVRAVNTYGNSLDSASDLATAVIFTDDPICLGFNNPADPPSCSGAAPTRIRAVHIVELATAINAVCTLAGTAAIPASPPAVNARIGAGYVMSMRAALDTARGHLNHPLWGGTIGYCNQERCRCAESFAYRKV